MIELVGGPRDGELVPVTPALQTHLVADRRHAGVRARDAADLLTVPLRVHVYEREWLDGHPTLSFAYRGLR